MTENLNLSLILEKLKKAERFAVVVQEGDEVTTYSNATVKDLVYYAYCLDTQARIQSSKDETQNNQL